MVRPMYTDRDWPWNILYTQLLAEAKMVRILVCLGSFTQKATADRQELTAGNRQKKHK